jgi:hypothetical protein
MSSPTQISYECFEELIRRLRGAGHVAAAEKLDFMLHKVAWTTGSELIGELGSEILSFQRSASDVSSELQRSLSDCMSMVRRFWPDIR